MTNRLHQVEALLLNLERLLKTVAFRLRGIILNAVGSITEQIKWDAMNFCYQRNGRSMLRLYPPKVANLNITVARRATATSSLMIRPAC